MGEIEYVQNPPLVIEWSFSLREVSLNETYIFLVFLSLTITSCGSSDNDAQNSVNESISDEKLENMFEEDKDKEKVDEVEPSPGEARRKVKKQFLEIEKAPTFPSLEVNASYSDHYAQSIDVIMNKLWSSEDICQDQIPYAFSRKGSRL